MKKIKYIKTKHTFVAILTLTVVLSMPAQYTNAYVLNGYTYPKPMKGSINYYVNSSITKVYSSVDTYVKKWSGLRGIGFSKVYNADPGLALSLAYVDSDNGTYGVCNYNSSSVKTITFYKSFKNATNSIKQETIVHEVGHALGLSHTQASNNSISVMRKLSFNGKAYPLSNDKSGIAALY